MPHHASGLLFAPARTEAADERVYLAKLALLVVLVAVGVVLALQSELLLAALGTVLAALDDRHDAALVRARVAARGPGRGRPWEQG